LISRDIDGCTNVMKSHISNRSDSGSDPRVCGG
jgi:hypothetical protein